MNILIADDSVLSRSYVKKLLGMVGLGTATIFEASNGKEALGIIESVNVQYLFLDINMPIMTGTELIDVMQEKNMIVKTNIIITSSIADDAHVAQLRVKGVKYFLRKPYTPEVLKSLTDVLKGVA